MASLFVRRRFLSAGGIAVLLLTMAAGVVLYWVRLPRLTPEIRGYRLAEEYGCHGCHGPRATGGVANPGQKDGEIPAWDGGMAMMYVESEGEIREWILDGYPERLKKKYESDQEQQARARLPIRMPAYRDVLSRGQIDDLVAYYKVIADFVEMPEDARRGFKIAGKLGCYGCHGPGGLIGASNPGSFKGYIPPWRGDDFEELVGSENELRAWIMDGAIERLDSNPFARFFTGRQVIAMPSYRDRLADGELDSIVAYVRWVSSGF